MPSFRLLSALFPGPMGEQKSGAKVRKNFGICKFWDEEKLSFCIKIT